MNERIKALWIEALESGKYAKGGGKLRDPADDTYCCLGVLCELARKEGIVTRRTHTFSAGYQETDYGPKGEHRDTGGLHVSGAVLPFAVRDWAGLDARNPEGIAAVNDTSETFAEYVIPMIQGF